MSRVERSIEIYKCYDFSLHASIFRKLCKHNDFLVPVSKICDLYSFSLCSSEIDDFKLLSQSTIAEINTDFRLCKVPGDD